MGEQIVLPMEWRTGPANEEILIGESNRAVLDALVLWQDWPNHTAILVGPPRSGRSLLANRFRQLTAGEVVDDAESRDDNDLFHQWNRAREHARPLLMTSLEPPSRWGVELPDLRSRLGAAMLMRIGVPDEELTGQLIVRHLSDFGTGISPDALAYALKRIERSYAAAENFAIAANDAALAAGRPITLAIVKPLLAGQGELEL